MTGQHSGGSVPSSAPTLASPGSQAPEHDVIVVGGGVAGLTVAHDLAHRGYRVVLLERRTSLGGVVARLDVGGLAVDAGAESFAVRGGHVAELLDELDLADDVVAPAGGGAWLTLADRSVRMPKASMLGIPSQPLARDVIDVLGMRGALRAWLDRLMPLVKVGKDSALGPLVERRMGAAVLRRLVSPISGGVYSSDARDLDPAVVAPGLNEAMSRAGSLSGGVAQLVADGQRPGSAVQGIRGGMHRLPEALALAATRFHADLRTDVDVTAVRQTEAGWAVDADDDTLTASALVIATDAQAAATLLAGVEPLTDLDVAEGASVELVTLVIAADDAGALADAPRGSGALVAEDAGIAAKALTHATAKWAWLADQADGAHVLRLSYGRAGEHPATAALSDAEAFAMARADASRILGVPVPEPVDAARVRWQQAQPSAALGARDRQRRVREATEGLDTLEVVGAWVAGTGLAQVVPDAREAAVRIRRDRFVHAGAPRSAPDATRQES